jgi:uncharacterized protein (TIGR02145 family)
MSVSIVTKPGCMNTWLLLLLAAILTVLVTGVAAQERGVLKDQRDGQTYKTVKIGTQTWMAENLNYAAEEGSWCYENDKANCAKYGRLYDWKAATESCPDGWHLPSADEWMEMINSLGGDGAAAVRMRARKDWKVFETVSSVDDSGFSALPAGYTKPRHGVFDGVGTETYWWSSTELGRGAWYFALRFDRDVVNMYGSNQKGSGFSVRCVKN